MLNTESNKNKPKTKGRGNFITQTGRTRKKVSANPDLGKNPREHDRTEIRGKTTTRHQAPIKEKKLTPETEKKGKTLDLVTKRGGPERVGGIHLRHRWKKKNAAETKNRKARGEQEEKISKRARDWTNGGQGPGG